MTAFSLAAAEEIGIVTARRLVALSGVAQLRLLAAALILFLVVDYVRLAVNDPLDVPDTTLIYVMDLLAYAAVLISLWRPRVGFGLAAIPLITALFWTSTSMDAALLLIVSALAIGQSTRVNAAIMSAALVAYLAARAALSPAPALLLLLLGTHAAVGIALGWVVLVLRERREVQERGEARLAGENARIRSDERRTLSRELHDVVAHQLSTASLQIMGAQGSGDPVLLQRALKRVDHATAEALTELRLLVRVLRDDPTTSASGTEIRELAEHLAPTEAAAAAERDLIAAGFEVDSMVPARADRLPMTTQRTVGRALRESAANVIAHARPRCRCQIRVSVSEQQVNLEVRSELPSGFTDASFGWGLRGLRERTALIGGTFSAGPVGSEWVLALSLPLD